MASYTGRPLYLQIADDLRRHVLAGKLPPGSQLPSISDLTSDYKTSTTTVRQAIGILRAEGYVMGHQGKGTFVRVARHPRIRAVDQRYVGRHGGSPMAAAIAAEGAEPSWEHQSHRSEATAAVAERLGIEVGAATMTTDYRFLADDQPVMLSTSHEPLAITGGSPIEWPESGPVVGVVARFDHIGHRIERVTEYVTARVPRPFEDQALHIPLGVPVLSIERTYYAGDTAVETSDIVVAADTYTLRYDLHIHDE